ncbi:MAG: peptidylprolyl isomerase [Bacteroidia bacterium]
MSKSFKSIFSLVLVLSAFTSHAQDVEKDRSMLRYPIFSFGDKQVLSDEFVRVFNKNKRDEVAPTKDEIEEYLDLYVKFKLKVEEAYARKMDTIPSFITELAGYRSQLAKPYLTDKTVTERLIKEAYDRSQLEVNASHLLINCPLDAKAKDSLAAYQKIMGLRARVTKGEDFGDLARKFSEDPSAKTNNGDLGYFTAFQMIYPFENAAFTQEVGQVSMPIRTQFGYHLVFVADRRKSLGDIQVSHIMMKYYNDGQIDSVKEKIDAVHAKLESGADWNTTVGEFSDDFNTNSKGGKLSWFNRTTANIPNEFKDVAYGLKNDGDYSRPIKTKFGWHIIRRESMKKSPSYEDSKEVIRRKVERDSRSELNKEVVVARVKKENNYQEVEGVSAVQGHFMDDLLQGKYTKKEGNKLVLFTIDNKAYTDDMFYDFVARNQSKSNKSLESAVSGYYNSFVDESNMEYEESILESKYDDFRYIMQEYKDGILLFELTDQEVWSKAVNDSAGLEKYYQNHSDQYMWKERADATIYSCKDEKSAKKASKQAQKGVSMNDILAKCNKKDPLAVTAVNKKYEKGSNELLDKVEWQKGVYKLDNENDRVKFVYIADILSPSLKPIEGNMGQATSDYQNYLEAEWIKELKVKYPVTIFENNVKKLYN